ncbi:MAG TPA: PIG-L family deacetylase [Ktedonobacterales bacterium]|jgi:LmbE family N-acetylglucosaminyl deacetylase
MSERQKSILACFAHPDDELGVASLVAQSVAQGARATLICTTNGDVGTVDDEYMRGYSSIAELRLAELACATKLIGFTEVVPFGYRDSGMMGSEDNQHPKSYWQVAPEAAVEQVAGVMRRVRPQIVITFNTFGAYGHPDHIKINQATLAAFEMLQGEPEHPEKLYYNTFSKTLARAALRMAKLMRRDPRKFGRNKDLDLQASFDAITPVTTRIPVAAKYRAIADEARRCHASQMQMNPVAEAVGKVASPLLFREVTLSRVIPPPQPKERIERDLFS